MKRVVAILLAIFIAAGAFRLPYGYYQVLRVVATVSFLFIAYTSHRNRYHLCTIIALVMAYIFNPLFPIYLRKSTWAVVDIAAGVLLVLLNEVVTYRLHKFIYCSMSMRLFVNDALAISQYVPRGLAINMIRLALASAMKTKEWQNSSLDLKTLSFVWLLKQVETMCYAFIYLGRNAEASNIKNFYLIITTIANTKSYLKVHPEVVMEALVRFSKIPPK